MAYKKLRADNVEYIIVHAAATPSNMDIGAAEIDRWHRERGFFSIGYHYVIRRDGTIEPGRALETPGAHVRGYNMKSVGICMVGGVDEGETEANFTLDQYRSLAFQIMMLRVQFPFASVVGHRDIPNVKKDCPCFDVALFCVEYSV